MQLFTGVCIRKRGSLQSVSFSLAFVCLFHCVFLIKHSCTDEVYVVDMQVACVKSHKQ